MITVKGRTLIIPEIERQIGTQYDSNSETRQIKINRLTPGGIDLSNLDFHLDLRYGKDTKDTAILSKEITEDAIILTWTVSAASVAQIGTVWIAVRGSDDFGTVKWATNEGHLYVGKTIDVPEGTDLKLTEFEQLEKKITEKTANLDANEAAREEAEKTRQANETARLNNEAVWQQQGEKAVEAAQTATEKAAAASGSASAAQASAGTASAAAQTATEKAAAASGSASVAQASAGTASAAAQTATEKATAASGSASAAQESAETASAAAQTATEKETAASGSASAAQASAGTASAAAQTATQKAAEADASAKAAAASAEKAQGAAEYDGTATTVKATDVLGLLGAEGATTNVQALIDEIADRVLSKLLQKTAVVNNLVTTEEGYALDARMGKSLSDSLSQLNSDLTVLNAKEIQFKPAVKPVFTSTTNLASGAEAMFTVTFDKAFSAVPTITFTLRTNGDLFLSQVDSISTTGFTGYIRNPFPSAKPVSDVSLCYIAMC